MSTNLNRTAVDWARSINPEDIAFFAVHPGVVRTNIAGNYGWQSLLFNAFNLFYLTPREGARTPIYLAADPKIQCQSGHYFKEYQKSRTHTLADDMNARQKLWVISEDLCRIKTPTTQA